MRFIPVLILLIVLIYLPSILYARHILQTKRATTAGMLAAYALPTIIIIAFIFIHYATRADIVDFRIMMWLLIALIAYLLPTNIYSLFYVLNKAINRIAHRNLRVLHHIGVALSIITAIGIITGIATRHRIQVREVTIHSHNLPDEFDGIRIAHITDLHLGNLSPRSRYLNRIVAKLTQLSPDMLVCTGDMFNLTATEAQGLDSLFSSITAPLGRYAVMGNHDYGDYCKWESEEAKHANLMATHQAYHNLGFTLLNDTAIYIASTTKPEEPHPPLLTTHSSFLTPNSTIGLIGVENWGNPPFPRYGNLAKATQSFTPAAFNILLSHDPHHWQSEVSTNPQYKYIDLTLSGHTHSAQIGIDLNNKYKWSPSQWMFQYWDGLYSQDNQHLFISRGLGYTAIPFRLGMPPEISIITLKKIK